MAGFRVYQYNGDKPRPMYFPLAAAQTFDEGDPVFISGNQVTASPKDGTVVAGTTEFFGFAHTAAQGEQSATRTGLSYSPAYPGGNTTNRMIGVIPAAPGLRMATSNFWTVVGATVQDVIGGSDLFGEYQMSSAAAGDWGLVDAAPTSDGTHASARIVAILDPQGRPFTAATADTTAGPSLVTIVFEISGLNQYTVVA